MTRWKRPRRLEVKGRPRLGDVDLARLNQHGGHTDRVLPDIGGYSTCSIMTKPAAAVVPVGGRTRLQFAAG